MGKVGRDKDLSEYPARQSVQHRRRGAEIRERSYGIYQGRTWIPHQRPAWIKCFEMGTAYADRPTRSRSVREM